MIKLIKKSRATSSMFFVFDNDYAYDEMLDKEAWGWIDYDGRVTNDLIIDSILDQGMELVKESDVDWDSHSNGDCFAISIKDICRDMKQKIRELKWDMGR